MRVSGNVTAGVGFIPRAKELGDLVLSTQTPQAARAYLGWIAYLGPNMYPAPTAVLEVALSLAEGDLVQAKIQPSAMIRDYQFFRSIASLYGLSEMVSRYDAEIARLRKAVPNEIKHGAI